MTEQTDSVQSVEKKPTKMRRAWIVAFAVVVIIAGVFIGSRIYASSVSAQAEDVPTLSQPPVAKQSNGAPEVGSDSIAGDTSGTWSVGSGSFAGYRLDEVLNGANVTVTGRTEDITGSLTVQEDQLIAADLALQVDTISTDSERRDQYFWTTAIDTGQFPEATFTLAEPVDVSASRDGGAQTFNMTGELTLNGRTVEVSTDVEAVFNDGQAQLVGQIPMTWADFGVEAPNLGFVAVEDDGFIEFSLNVAQN
ncbi:YceI family protein [Glutamicibacter sp. 287]|uniref:YceI family protein n=1 Tax=Glutamicibacter sp. 287 TaxID=3457732 RepID=UPI004033B0EE